MKREDGSIRQLPSGRFQVRIRMANGDRVPKGTYVSEKEAQQRLDACWWIDSEAISGTTDEGEPRSNSSCRICWSNEWRNYDRAPAGGTCVWSCPPTLTSG
jgi:hypothetical protein